MYTEKGAECGLLMNVSQAVQFAGATVPRLRCLHQNSCIYSYEADWTFVGSQYAQFHGFPKHLKWECTVDDLSRLDPMVTQLIGEGYSFPSAGSALMSAFCSPGAPWFDEAHNA